MSACQTDRVPRGPAQLSVHSATSQRPPGSALATEVVTEASVILSLEAVWYFQIETIVPHILVLG